MGEKYIQEKLTEKRRAAQSNEQSDTPTDLNLFTDQDRILYAIPQHLQSKVQEEKVETSSLGNLSNLEEVDLPSEYRLDNIRATQEASKTKIEPSTAEEQDEEHVTHWKRFRNTNSTPEPRSERATNGLVAERFKKR